MSHSVDEDREFAGLIQHIPMLEETVWLGDTPVATLRPNGSTVAIYYVHSDPLNTPRQVTRPSDNTILWTWNSDPFGTDAANPSPSGAGVFTYNLRFPGQVFDGQAGLHQNYVREFDPAVGQYIESDPLGLRGGGVNPYSYVLNNPLIRRDVSGLTPWDWDGIGDTRVCEYYEKQAQTTRGPYYDGALKACRGLRVDINALLKTGIVQAWVVHSTTASESEIFDTIRRGLI